MKVFEKTENLHKRTWKNNHGCVVTKIIEYKLIQQNIGIRILF